MWIWHFRKISHIACTPPPSYSYYKFCTCWVRLLVPLILPIHPFIPHTQRSSLLYVILPLSSLCSTAITSFFRQIGSYLLCQAINWILIQWLGEIWCNEICGTFFAWRLQCAAFDKKLHKKQEFYKVRLLKQHFAGQEVWKDIVLLPFALPKVGTLSIGRYNLQAISVELKGISIRWYLKNPGEPLPLSGENTWSDLT